MWPGRPSSAPGWAERGCRVEPAPPTPPTWRIPSLPWRAGGDRVQGNSTLGFVSTRQKCRAAAARASQPGGEEAALVRSLCFWAGGGRDFCPRHRELPRAPVPQSPRDQQALRPALPMTSSGCVALTAPTRARLNHGARGVGTFAGHVATGSDPKHRATWLQLTCPVGNSCEKLVQSAPSTGFHQCPATGNTPRGHLPLETVKRPWPR